jgi:hypothetical protein
MISDERRVKAEESCKEFFLNFWTVDGENI